MASPHFNPISSPYPQNDTNMGYASLQPSPYQRSQSELYSGSAYGGHAAEPLKPLKIASPEKDRRKHRRYENLKKALHVGKIVTKVLTAMFATVTFASSAYITINFQTTNNNFVNGRTAWPANPKPWPTFMFLAVSGVTLVLSFVTLFSYCRCYHRARRSWKLTVAKYAIHIGVWIIASAIYRIEKGLNGNNNDLWGWSCSDKADAIQDEFNGIANFNVLCNIQASTPRLRFLRYYADCLIRRTLGACRLQRL